MYFERLMTLKVWSSEPVATIFFFAWRARAPMPCSWTLLVRAREKRLRRSEVREEAAGEAGRGPSGGITVSYHMCACVHVCVFVV